MKKHLLITSLALCCLFSTSAQTKQDSIPQKKVEFSLMPFVNYNRNLEFMFGVIPMFMYKLDQNDMKSPKSLSGVSGVYTTNKSYFFAFFNRWYFKEDTWRAKLFAVTGDQNSQFFMDDYDSTEFQEFLEKNEMTAGFYDYETKTTMVSFGVQRKIIEHLYVGLTYTFAHYDTDYEDNVKPSSITQTNGLEPNILYDSRDAVYYPKSGINTKIRFIMFPEWFGNDESANKILTEYNTYFPMRDDKDVLAARFSGKFGLGSIAFEQQVTIGNKDIRGYTEGKYRGDGLMALQGEYRFNFNEKMGLVGFAGLATIYGSDNDSFNWKAYPGGGIGYRYRAFKAVKFNIGLDAAVGKGDWGVYFRIGEAF